MNIKPDQLPIQQFERLGISQERLKKLPKDEIQNLLSGYPSNMKFLVFKDQEGNTRKVNAKLSVYQTNDGTVGLKVHPYCDKIKNDMDLDQKELDQLKSGKAITKRFDNREFLIQLDNSINELRRIRMDHIRIAEAIGNSKLTEKQKTDLLSGKKIDLKDASGRITKINLDLKRSSGVNIESPKENIRHEKSIKHEQHHEPTRQEQIRMKR